MKTLMMTAVLSLCAAAPALGAQPAQESALGSPDEYQKKLQDELDSMKADIAKLEKKAQGFETKTREEGLKSTRALRRKREAVEKKLAKLKKASKDNWGKLKDGLEDARRDLRKAYDDVVTRFK